MITGRLQASGRATIPQEVRDALNLKEGDVLRYEIDGNRVRLSKSDDDEGDEFFLDEELQPIIDAALADRRPTVSIDDAFAEVKARIAAKARRMNAA